MSALPFRHVITSLAAAWTICLVTAAPAWAAPRYTLAELPETLGKPQCSLSAAAADGTYVVTCNQPGSFTADSASVVTPQGTHALTVPACTTGNRATWGTTAINNHATVAGFVTCTEGNAPDGEQHTEIITWDATGAPHPVHGGALSGAGWAYAEHINAQGDLLVRYCGTDTDTCLYRPSTGTTTPLRPLRDGAQAIGYALADDGTVVGTDIIVSSDGIPSNIPLWWDTNGTPHRPAGTDGKHGFIYTISPDGTRMAGALADQPGEADLRAVHLSRTAVPTSMGLDGHGQWWRPRFLTNSGIAYATWNNYSGAPIRHAFIQSGAITVLDASKVSGIPEGVDFHQLNPEHLDENGVLYGVIAVGDAGDPRFARRSFTLSPAHASSGEGYLRTS